MCLESALEQAERRFAAFEIVDQGGHGPFRGLEAPFALKGRIWGSVEGVNFSTDGKTFNH